MDRVLEVDAVSRAARIQAGATGPGLEDQLREHGLTLRHFPQSFEYSTLGGWIATRAGGHFATLAHAHRRPRGVGARDHPAGAWESRRLPGSGAGPSPDRHADRLGGHPGRHHRGVGAGAGRARASRRRPASCSTRSRPARRPCGRWPSRGLLPSNCRLLDPDEAALTGAAPTGRALLVLGFESADHPLEAWLRARARALRDHGGEVHGEPATSERGESEGAWRDAFLQAPYLRDTLVAAGILAETFETAITWDRFEDFVAGVREATAGRAGRRGPGHLPAHARLPRRRGALLHGAGPGAPRRRSSSSGTRSRRPPPRRSSAAGGTITHHHAVGRDHRPWYDRQRPEPFAAALRRGQGGAGPRRDPQSRVVTSR